MADRPEISVLGSAAEVQSSCWLQRAAALVEACAVFVLAHVSFRVFKQFTWLGKREGEFGLNYSTGIVLVLFGVGSILLGRRRFASYGLTARTWRRDVSVGLLGGLLLAGGAALLVQLTPLSPAVFQRPDRAVPLLGAAGALAGAVGHLLVLLVLLWILKCARPLGSCWLAAPSTCLLVGLLGLPVVLAAARDRQPLLALTAVGWLFACAGFGEEIFFHGYVQSRVNEAFGRPWRVFGVECGLGLVVSSLLFGAIHVLNTVDYFTGQFEFAWWLGVTNVFAGFSLGLLREKTGNVVAGGVAHGLMDVLVQIPRILASKR